MGNTIERLWNGAVTPGEQCAVGDPEIEKIISLIEGHKEKLNSELGQRQKAVFEKYADCTDEYAALLSERAFCDGFCLASKLMAEALLEKSN